MISKKPLDTATKTKLEIVVKESFSSKDFHQVNMRGIAKQTGIGLNTIYSHYQSKERLLFSFIAEWIKEFDLRLAEHLQGLEDHKEKIRKVIWVLLDFYENNPDIAQIILFTVPLKTWSRDDTFKAKIVSDRILAIFRQGQEQGVFDPDLSVRYMFDVLYGIIHRAIYLWLYQKNKESLTSRVNIFYEIIWRVVRNPL